MIQIYSPENDNFDNNGDMTLFPSEASEHTVLGGERQLELVHPIDDEGRWKYIVVNAVISAPCYNGVQLFRIVDTDINDTEVTATAQPIFYDSANEVFLTDVRPTDKLAQDALDILMEDTKYSGETDLVTQSTAYYEYKNLMEALNGDIDQSFLNRWGGEIEYDNFTIIINEQIGEDNGVEIRYGKNIPENGFSVIEDMDGVVTRVYPKGYDGVTMSDDGYVDSEHIDDYPIVRAATETYEYIYYTVDMDEDEIADLEDDEDAVLCETQDELDEALTEAVQADFDAGLDTPSVTISVDLILLQNTDQYQDAKVLETVSLGDTVNVINTHIGFSTSTRVIEIEYNCLTERIESVVLGDAEYDYFKSTSKTLSDLQDEIETSQTVLQTAISNATSLITGNSGGYVVLYDSNGDGQPDELLILDKPSISEAENVWRWNLSGLGHSSSGYNGDYEIAMTYDGAIVADFITAGTMYADRIKGGTLTLGGEDNVNGILEIQDSDGDTVGLWNNSGITAIGSFTSVNGDEKAMLASGLVRLYYDDDDIGEITLTYKADTYVGIGIYLQYAADCMNFGYQASADENSYSIFMMYDRFGNVTGYENILRINSYIHAPNFIRYGDYTFEEVESGTTRALAYDYSSYEFEHAPRIIVYPSTMYPAHVHASVKNITKSDCEIYLTRDSDVGTADTKVNWIIIYDPYDE